MSSIYIVAIIVIFSLVAYFQHLVKKDEEERHREQKERQAKNAYELSRLRERAARRRSQQQAK